MIEADGKERAVFRLRDDASGGRAADEASGSPVV